MVKMLSKHVTVLVLAPLANHLVESLAVAKPEVAYLALR